MEEFDINKFLKKTSSRHHYIPKFLIKGFTNDEGFLYVYDKKKNYISNKKTAPESIFYEWDRNTIEVTQSKESSIIEDEFFKKIDNLTSLTVKNFQEEELDKIEFTPENTAHFLFFLVTLFWRVPYTDFAVKDLMNRSKIISEGIDSEILRNDPTYQKLQRAGLFNHAILEIIQHGKRGSKSFNIHQTIQDIYVIGDNPILFRRPMTLFSEFDEVDCLIALNSRRIYSSTNKKLNGFTTINSHRYNTAVINQSKRYIACSNLIALEQSVQWYLEFKKMGIAFMMAERAFETD